MCVRVSKLKKAADRLAGCRCVIMVELSSPVSLMGEAAGPLAHEKWSSC